LKKIFLSLLFAVVLFSHGFGKTVDANRAKTVASNYMASMPIQFPQGNPGGLTLCYSAVGNNSSALKESSAPLFYVFNVTGSHGFIIISADDIIPRYWLIPQKPVSLRITFHRMLQPGSKGMKIRSVMPS